ncbi:hypothetical protein [Aneurinibacillus terranovensis]|uniref:hypothetical protein n=1 Tax=Aneurinibacillus terranovensis TaxID=278991 RepID=UPI000408EA04|nr:hypothetical protein [Aneurinibacillus terranovensis]
MKSVSPIQWFDEFQATDRVLLINPPVHDVRYAWIRWNQPTGLLLLSSKLSNEVGCKVELFDLMLPDHGRVPIRDTNRQKVMPDKDRTVYKTRAYGMQMEVVRTKLSNLKSEWIPTHIVISTLTSYWYESLLTLVPLLRTLFPEIRISLIGGYAVLESEHAKRTNVDYLVNDFIDFDDYLPDFKLYANSITHRLHDGRLPEFGGLSFTRNNISANLLKQVDMCREMNIRNFVIMENNLFRDECLILSDFLFLLEKKYLQVNLHGICGIDIAKAVDGIFTKMQKGGYRSFFLEYDLDGEDLNLDSYRRVYRELVKNQVRYISSGDIAGFLMIGTQHDNLERMFKHSFQLLEICGSIIPKPYTPDPGTEDYKRISKQRLDFLSPHVFPMAEQSGISRKEYQEFYQHASFLNEKRLGKSFDFFDEHYSSVALRKSLGKKV